jgi:hypothetical protein
VGDTDQGSLAVDYHRYVGSGRGFRSACPDVHPVVVERRPGAGVGEPSGNVGTGENHLVGVALDSRGVAWAVGHSADVQDKNARTLIARNDGSSWTVVSSQNATVKGNNMLGGIAIVGGDMWAVGSFDGVNAAQTLVMHRCQ